MEPAAPKPKTYKREMACALLGVYVALLIASLWFEPALEAAESIKVLAFTFALGAFGADALAKQIAPK